MYSPAAWDSIVRAAPAKNLRQSAVPEISSPVAETGLPALSDSTAMRSSARASIKSANLKRAVARSKGVVRLHDTNASAAAVTAKSTSCASDTAELKISVPVEGSRTALVRPDSELLQLPPIKFSFRTCKLDTMTPLLVLSCLKLACSSCCFLLRLNKNIVVQITIRN